MTRRTASVVLVLACFVLLTGCGVVFAPFSLAKAMGANANYNFVGTVIDPAEKPLEGVVAVKSSQRQFWSALQGTKTTYNQDFIRVDGSFNIVVRGANLSVTFSKNGYRDVAFRFSAEDKKEISTELGYWRNAPDFTVLMVPVNARDAYLVQNVAGISYEHYPIADMIALPNLLSEGASGDIIYKQKDTADPTVIPDGTLYALLDNTPPTPINQFGQIDPAELDIPNAVTLRIAGPNTGFQRIAPRAGLHPMHISTTAPQSSYVPELVFSRERLKEMRKADRYSIAEAREYFFYRLGDNFGKGVFYWTNSAGKPHFTYELYLQRRPATRDLTTFSYKP